MNKQAQNALIGFDIGGTKCAVILGRDEGPDAVPQIVAREMFPTSQFPRPDAAIAKLAELAREVCRRHGVEREQLRAGGVSCGGPLHSASDRILSPPNLPGWDDVPIVEQLGRALDGLPVALQNDANACALAEWRWGAGRGAEMAVFLTFGTGMGAGLIIGGRLHEGRDDLAGEVGHWRLTDDGLEGFGKRGSFEGWCSGGGMARLAREKVRAAWARGEAVGCCPDEGVLERLDVRVLSQAARAGDGLAREVFAVTARHLGQALSLLVDLLNPEVIVLGSIFVRCEDLLRAPMEEVLAAETLPAARHRCRVVPAGLVEDIGDYASLAVASQIKTQ